MVTLRIVNPSPHGGYLLGNETMKGIPIGTCADNARVVDVRQLHEPASAAAGVRVGAGGGHTRARAGRRAARARAPPARARAAAQRHRRQRARRAPRHRLLRRAHRRLGPQQVSALFAQHHIQISSFTHFFFKNI